MAMKRIAKETAALNAESWVTGFSVVQKPEDKDSDFFKWTAFIDGRIALKGSPYEGGVFEVSVVFPVNYPFRPPRMWIENKIYHCNVFETSGNISLEMLSDTGWSPAMNLGLALRGYSWILTECNPLDTFRPEIAIQYTQNRDEHDRIAREWTLLYAAPGEGFAAAAEEVGAELEEEARREGGWDHTTPSVWLQKRTEKDAKQVNKDSESTGFSVRQDEPGETNVKKWTAWIDGRVWLRGTPYEEGVFELWVEYPTEYPFKPLRLYFKHPSPSKIYHCNVDPTLGTIKSDMLSLDGWSPACNVLMALREYWSVMGEPFFGEGDAVRPDVAIQYKENREEHDRIAKELTEMYAAPQD